MASDIEQKAASKVRHDWYQTDKLVIVSIMLKNVDEKKLILSFGERNMFLACPIPNTDHEYKLELLLAHKIKTDLCTRTVMSSKIEVKLHKKEFKQWLTLEGEEEEVIMKSIYQEVNLDPAALNYPSSAINKRDWNGVVRELKEEEKIELRKPMPLKDSLRHVYADGSEEMRRAMDRSFIESGGTEVTANWEIACSERIKKKKTTHKAAE